MFRRAFPILALCAGLTTGHAAPVAITNPGFEDISTAQQTYNEFTFGSFPGWSLYDLNSVAGVGTGVTYYVGTLTPRILPARDPVNYQNFPAGAYEGQRVGIAFNYANATPGNEYGLQQTLTSTLAANTRYTLTVRIGNIASGWSVDNTFFNLNGFPGYRVDLLAGNTLLASDNNSLAGTIPEGGWGQSTVVYESNAAPAGLNQNLRIRLVNLNVVGPTAPTADREVDFDAVSLNAVPVPEPGVTSLLFALLGVGALLRRRHASRAAKPRYTAPRSRA